MQVSEANRFRSVRLLIFKKFNLLFETFAMTWITWIGLITSTLFILWVVNPGGVLFTQTTPTGGDLGAHVWGPAFIRDELLPRFRLSGWAPDWYAGFPAFHFYMVVPMLFVVVLDVGLIAPLAVVVVVIAVLISMVLIWFRPQGWQIGLWILGILVLISVPFHYGVAFKIVTVAGLVLMPIAGWLLGRLAGLPFPGPMLTGAATLAFIFDRSFNIMGGNLMSTMAGEFAFALAVSACLVYLGLLVRGMETGKNRGWAAVLLAATGLCHLLVAFFALLATAIAFFLRPGKRTFIWIATMGTVAGLLSAFWVLPFWWRSEHLNDMAWEKLTWFSSYLWSRDRLAVDFLTNDPPLQPVVVLAGLGLLLSILFRRRLGVILALSSVVLALAFIYLPEGRLYNGRLLPAYYLSLYLLSAIAIAEVLRLLGRLFDGIWVLKRGIGNLVSGFTALLAIFLLIVSLGMPLRVLPGGSMDGNTYRWMGMETEELNLGRSWVNWNFGGYEVRQGDQTGGGWDELVAFVATLDDLTSEYGCGRLMWEYSSDLTRYGTPMAPMLLPYWTEGCLSSMEGLYFESATTTPFHFLIQSELSDAPSRAQRNLPYRSVDLLSGVDHLQQFGVGYFAAFSENVVEQALTHPDLVKKAESGPWEIFRVLDSDLVVPLSVEPAVWNEENHRDWLESAVEIFQEGSSAVVRTIGGLDSWQRVTEESDPEVRFLPTAQVTNISQEVDKVAFTVDRVGVPVVVKVSYFPNWEAKGAAGPWRATPNLMVVVPTESHVTLSYSRTGIDVISLIFTVVGLIFVLVLFRIPDPEDFSDIWFDAMTVVPLLDHRINSWVNRRIDLPDNPKYENSFEQVSIDGDENQNLSNSEFDL